jgi:hypothetical protein
VDPDPLEPAPAEPLPERLEAPLDADPPEPLDALEELLEDLVVPLADTTSPTCPASETIVPSCGA